MREDEVRHAIENMPGASFERFVFAVFSRHIYPGLLPTSPSDDLGEDAYTAPSLIFEHGGQLISLAISKTATLDKIEEDCDRAQETGRAINVLVFVTTTGPTGAEPTTGTIDNWRKQVQSAYGWDLEVRTLSALVSLASRPEYEDLVDQYLRVPPLDGDYFSHIQAQFELHTRQNLRLIKPNIPGLKEPLPRNEISEIETQLGSGHNVVLTGNAGTGKSALGATLALNAKRAGKTVLCIDARRLGKATTETELRMHFDLKGSLRSAIKRAGRHTKCRVILDQLDNIAGSIVAELLTNIAVDSLEDDVGIEWVCICRNETDNEKQLLTNLLEKKDGFSEHISRPLSDDLVIEALTQIGVLKLNSGLIQLCRNLLNLELVGIIYAQQPLFDFSMLADEIELWEQYLIMLREREGITLGATLIAEAVRLAKDGLSSPDGTFITPFPASYELDRLHSWGIIERVDGRQCQFRHEKLQDYLFAWDAAQRHAKPQEIMPQIIEYKSSNIFELMKRIYRKHSPLLYQQFLKDVFGVNQ